MDWNNPAHVAQAIFWAIAILSFFVGYHMGNRQ